MQNRSLPPTSWGKVGLDILPGLFALGASWAVRVEDVTPLHQGVTG